jgi:hypothetical protein
MISEIYLFGGICKKNRDSATRLHFHHTGQSRPLTMLPCRYLLVSIGYKQTSELTWMAFRRALFMDASSPVRFVESFLLESWLEHLRQHEQPTVDDRMTEADVGPEGIQAKNR